MPTISFIKIYGPPVYDAIKELEKIAVTMPEVCIMNTLLDYSPNIGRSFGDSEFTSNYFEAIPVEIEVERCNTIISRSGQKLGEYDFFFEWFTKPTFDQINQLLKKIDETLKPLGCKYTITTKN